MSSLPDDQHMARVTIPEEQWLEFRAFAIRKKRSVAAYLGQPGQEGDRQGQPGRGTASVAEGGKGT